MDSVHFYGEKDEFKPYMTEHKLFTHDPLIIKYNEGHKFPREISQEDFKHLNAFL